MRFDIISLFPETIENYCSVSILKRVFEKKQAELYLHDLKNYGIGKYKKVDDKPFGGGTGQILRPEPIFEAHKAIKKLDNYKTIVLCANGQILKQPFIRNNLVNLSQIIIICGRYEGIDQRVIDYLADYSISLGNYVLTGGEIGAMTIIDSVCRLLPEVFTKGSEVTNKDSFSDEKGEELESAQYTRPREYLNMKVPDILLNGNHSEIEKWRKIIKKH